MSDVDFDVDLCLECRERETYKGTPFCLACGLDPQVRRKFSEGSYEFGVDSDAFEEALEETN